MFYGEYEHTLDRKGRLVIPSRFREVLKEHFVEKFFVTRGLERCLFVFPEDEWRSQEQKFKSMSFTRADSRRFNRLFFGGASEVILDKQGRILLPQTLKKWAGIKREIIVVGVSNRFELWNRDNWEEYYGSSRESFEDIAERLIEPGASE